MNPAQRWVLIVGCLICVPLVLFLPYGGYEAKWVFITDINLPSLVKWPVVFVELLSVLAVTGAAYLFMGGEPNAVARWVNRKLLRLPDDEQTGDEQDDEQRR